MPPLVHYPKPTTPAPMGARAWLREAADRLSRRARAPLVLLYNDFFGQSLMSDALDEKSHCRLTEDRALLRWADAVLLHLPGLRTRRDIPRKYPGQLWVGYTMESDLNRPLQTDPWLTAKIDVWMSYRRTAQVPVTYIAPGRLEDYQAAPKPKTESAPAAIFVSNEHTASGREHLLDEFARWMPVDRYGRSGANRKLERDEGRVTKLATLSRYRFGLALENAIEPDYVTEKLFDCFVAGTIPVYLGAPNVEDVLPGDHCYIRADYFASPRELAEYLTRLASDEAACAEYHAWRTRPLRTRFLQLYAESRRPIFARLFEHLATSRGGKWRGTDRPVDKSPPA